MPEYVLDTSALLGYVLDEEGSDRIEEILEELRRSGAVAALSFMSAMEIEYRLVRDYPAQTVSQTLLLLASSPLLVYESDLATRREAARIKSRYRLSVADAWIAALALTRGATLVHKDPEFDQIGELVAERLPYKPRTSR